MKDTFSLVTPRASSTSSTPWSSPLSPAEEEESGPSPTPEKSFHLKAAGDAAAAAVARVFFFEAGSGWGENLAEANVQQEWEKSLRQLCTKAAVAAGRAVANKKKLLPNFLLNGKK
jgi:hypothetical protein